MTNFTPGPWRLHDMEDATIVAGKPGGEVANCLNGFGDQDANAWLIAAAPDLFKALSQIVFDWDGEPGDMQEALEAIAKARGHDS